ncbi:MAG: initiation control protein YabA [Lactobacillales bacterium]|jgi:regulator of replication initiation timing|nr:initiation control protein YabA [Lactobacillales bacterium]
MDNKVWHDRLVSLEKNLNQILTEVHEVNHQLQEMMMEKAFISLENKKLKEKLLDYKQLYENKEISNKNKSSKSVAKGCLESLYNDGFHICNAFYGSSCLDNEECLLCLEMLDR